MSRAVAWWHASVFDWLARLNTLTRSHAPSPVLLKVCRNFKEGEHFDFFLNRCAENQTFFETDFSQTLTFKSFLIH